MVVLGIMWMVCLDIDVVVNVLEIVYDWGVNFIDLVDIYGNGDLEWIFG